MKVRREDHWKPQSPVREGRVVYPYFDFTLNMWRDRYRNTREVR